jgi:hypothetical protein
VEVTNLSDTGVGSLRWALDQYVDTIYVYKDAANPNFPVTIYQPLTVVFNVSGTIYLKSEIRIKRDNLTIAGQTAPCSGICITSKSVLLNGATGAQLFLSWSEKKKCDPALFTFSPRCAPGHCRRTNRSVRYLWPRPGEFMKMLLLITVPSAGPMKNAWLPTIAKILPCNGAL